MRRVTCLSTLFVLLSLSTFAQTPQKPSSPTLVLTHVTIIDLSAAAPLPDRTVVITANRISSIGAGNSPLPQGARVIDVSNNSSSPASGTCTCTGAIATISRFSSPTAPPALASCGAAPISNNSASKSKPGNSSARACSSPARLSTARRPSGPGAVSVHSPEEARQAVDLAKQRGADFIKEYSFLPRDLYFAIADESKKQNLSFVGHVPFSVSAEEASDAGQKSMEHLLGLLPSCSSREQDFRQAAQADLAEMLASGHSKFEGPHVREIREDLISTYNPPKSKRALCALQKERHLAMSHTHHARRFPHRLNRCRIALWYQRQLSRRFCFQQTRIPERSGARQRHESRWRRHHRWHRRQQSFLLSRF